MNEIEGISVRGYVLGFLGQGSIDGWRQVCRRLELLRLDLSCQNWSKYCPNQKQDRQIVSFHLNLLLRFRELRVSLVRITLGITGGWARRGPGRAGLRRGYLQSLPRNVPGPPAWWMPLLG